MTFPPSTVMIRRLASAIRTTTASRGVVATSSLAPPKYNVPLQSNKTLSSPGPPGSVACRTFSTRVDYSLHHKLLDPATVEEYKTLRRFVFSDQYDVVVNHNNNNNVVDDDSRWDRLADLTQDPEIRKISKQVHEMTENHPSSPGTIDEVLQDPRPIVVTTSESPYRIVHVNDAWVSLCGYKKEEAIGRTVSELLHGPDTELDVARDLVLRDSGSRPSSQVVVTNYTKQGRKFSNLIKLTGMVKGVNTTTSSNSTNDPQEMLLVGVLQEIGSSL